MCPNVESTRSKLPSSNGPLGVSLPPLDLKSFRVGFGPARVEQLDRKVEPSHASSDAGCGQSGIGSAACDVEHAHPRRDAGARHHELAHFRDVRRARALIAALPHGALSGLELVELKQRHRATCSSDWRS
jgi:hypothetical protein